MISLEGKRIWVAGHGGMVGSALVRRLSGLPEVKILTVDSRDLDLTDRAATTA
ncbi:NAD-dependent epimerase/dehydratase family protein [Mesorhizobium mediterraneum]|uniref:NAD-dependent epimerase/dehydratase family protein n=1 Tax=Mesorhizobium mediterraneum TaxID=43617 RepID=UPI0032B7034B